MKVADFGTAMKLGGGWDQAAFESACSTRRPRWTAPEAIKHFGGTRPSSESLIKSEVYSFGMICYEVLTGKYPFDGMKDGALLKQIEAGVRLELPGELDNDLKGIITSCWDPDPNKRPNFQSICHLLDYIRYDNICSFCIVNCLSSLKPKVQFSFMCAVKTTIFLYIYTLRAP